MGMHICDMHMCMCDMCMHMDMGTCHMDMEMRAPCTVHMCACFVGLKALSFTLYRTSSPSMG